MPEAGMRDALNAEWIKLRTVPGTCWLVITAVAVTVAVGVFAVTSVTCSGASCGQDPAKLSLTGIVPGQAVFAILGVLAISAEISTGMIKTTLMAVPRRITVLAAKAAVVTAVVVVAGTVTVLACVLVGRLVLPGHGFTAAHGLPPLSLGDGPVLRAAAGSVLYLALIGLLAMGVAAAVRDSATSIGIVLGLLYVFPIVAQVVGPSWQRRLEQIGPMSAGLDIQATTNLNGQPLSPWAGLGVLALWAAAALIIGGVLLRLRDA
jgi:ABC-2 type transport system permease protein